ncbi:PTS transporter subunit EIIC [Entomospira nematocerorum]|uniref:PTS transporter subunit EIIC n=1 Tax=Entomospira nematocerorum TaxID=2719987 RepID=A0A968KSQ6_9SPIO|nr:PTS transporter subunit EIIC [Entomospira nematocera]NIZ46830.1 PTS transporter subunit EIIC [Entomospira nematocera]WDI33372.1 PTS transporter subunit EIIC [Entomospira nematocera]
MDAKHIASALLTEIQADNIIGLHHCATRLRFRLKNEDAVDVDAVKNIQGVLSVIKSGGQFQVIIGPGVIDVYRHLMNTLKITDATPRLNKGQNGLKIQDAVFNYIAGSLQPILPAMAGAGIIRGLLALFISLEWLSTTSGTYLVLSAIGDSAFYFLPIILGFSAAKSLNANPFLGAVIGAAIMHPNIEQMASLIDADWRFLGLPFIPMNYANSVLPILVGIAIFAPLERFLNRIIPKGLTIILVSFLSLIIMIPLMIMLFGPTMYYISAAIAQVISFFLDRVPIIAGALIGSTWFLLVTMGLHWSLIPITYIQNAEYGYSSLLALFWISTMAQIGVSIAVVMRNPSKDFKMLMRPSIGVALLAGITEPLIYGVVLKYRRLIPIVAITGGIGGALTALFHINAIPAGLGGILSWPAFANVNSSLNFAIAILIQVLTLIIATILTLLIGYEKGHKNVSQKE